MTERSRRAVLDASAVLALLHDEPGADVVAGYLVGASVSAVNVAEILGKLLETGIPDAEAAAVLLEIGLDVIPFDEQQAHLAASLRRRTRRAGLSLGDRACLALALTLDLPAVTTDTAWKRAKIGVPVVVAR